MKPKLFLLIWLIAFIYINEIFNVIRHEAVHEAEYRYWGYNATVEIDYIGIGGVTTPTENVTIDDLNRMHQVQMFNEIFSYNLLSIRLVLYFICFILLSIFDEIRRN